MICVVPFEGREEMADVLEHPIDGVLKAHGSYWTYDAFTCRMLQDNVVRDTGEPVPQTAKKSGPETLLQQRRITKSRPRMRTHNPPEGR